MFVSVVGVVYRTYGLNIGSSAHDFGDSHSS